MKSHEKTILEVECKFKALLCRCLLDKNYRNSYPEDSDNLLDIIYLTLFICFISHKKPMNWVKETAFQ